MRLAALCALALLTSCGDHLDVKPIGRQEGRAQTAITIRSLDKPGAEIVENHGQSQTVRVHVEVEQRDGEKWKDTGTNVKLVERCTEAEADQTCRNLPAGARLTVAPWNGMDVGGQCPESHSIDENIGPGTFRFVVTSCDGKDRFEGDPFDMPGETPPPPYMPDAKK
jgi:hypothetical protein